MSAPAPRSARRNTIILTLALLLGAALGQSGLTPGLSGFLDARVEGVPAAPAALAASLYAFDDTLIGTLPITREGDSALLRGPLPDLSGAPQLLPADADALWPCPVQVSDPSARFTPVRAMLSDLGTLALLVPEHPDAPLGGEAYLVLVYADAPVRIEGRCEDDLLHVDLMLQPGWGLLASQQLGGLDEGWIVLRNAAPIEASLAVWQLESR